MISNHSGHPARVIRVSCVRDSLHSWSCSHLLGCNSNRKGWPSSVCGTGMPDVSAAFAMDCRSLDPGPTWRCGSAAGFCTATCDVAVLASPPQYGVVKVLWGWPALRCGATVAGRLCRNHPGMVTVPGLKCSVVRVQMMGVKWGQRTGRWLEKAWRKLLLNSF